MHVPPLETQRLMIRPFSMDDLDAIHQILDLDLGTEGAKTHQEREKWLQWTILSTEATQALIDYAFTQLQLKRIVATTTYENVASIGVMRKLGMHIEQNPYPDPPWFQVIGLLENRPANSLQTKP
jgi:hypothetical protein